MSQEPSRPFEVDEIVILRPPHLPGEEFKVSFRGLAGYGMVAGEYGQMAVVYNGTSQPTVLVTWLSHQPTTE